MKYMNGKNYGFEMLSDEDLEKICGGQSMTQPAVVTGTLGKSVIISCNEEYGDEYNCGQTEELLFKKS